MRIYFRIIVCLSFFLFGKGRAFAQNEFGQKTITVGITHSLFRGIHKIKYLDFDPYFKWTPGFQLHADFALVRRLSVGFGGTFHHHQLRVDDYSFEAGTSLITENFTETIDVFAGYGRVLIHMKEIYENSLDEVDVYCGGQVMFLSYRTHNTSSDPSLNGESFDIREILAMVGGTRYFPTDFIGVHAEFAIPGAYTFSIGASFRFGGRPKFFH